MQRGLMCEGGVYLRDTMVNVSYLSLPEYSRKDAMHMAVAINRFSAAIYASFGTKSTIL